MLGDNGRFRVVHKLGVGGFGTVWLCRDNQEQKWRALKILAARVSDPEECIELRVKEYFDALEISHEEAVEAHVSMPLEYFWIEGPNGKHLIQLLEFLGPHLVDFFKVYGRSRAIIKDTCLQLVNAMDFLHSTEVCHGDFRPENVMVRLVSDIHNWSEKKLRGALGKPDVVPVFRLKETKEDGSDFEVEWDIGVPRYLVPASNLDFGSGICSREIAVSDLGVAYKFSDSPDYTTGIPFEYAAPESYFSVGGLGPASDVWSLACTICWVATGRDMIYKTGQFNYAVELGTYMGPMPKPFREALKRDVAFDPEYAYNIEE